MVFAGTASFAVPSLQALVSAGHRLALVVTQPDRPAGRGLKPQTSAVKDTAIRLELPVYQPDGIRDLAAQERIMEERPDLMVVVAYGQILPAELLDRPAMGTVNVHASLLPKYRGAAPVEWAILEGEPQTGVTIMRMDSGVDTGPILAQEQIPIGPQENAGQLEERLARAGSRLLVQTIEDMCAHGIEPSPQPAQGASQARRLRSEDGKLDPARMSAVEIDRRVRALAERIGTWMPIMGAQVKVLRGHLGTDHGEGVAVPTAEGTYIVDELQPAGGRRMSAAAWLRGRR